MKMGSFRLTPHALLLTLLFASVAGAGWVQQTSNTMLSFRDVCFVDSLYGWTVGGWSAPPPNSYIGICLRTTDGGNQWVKVYQINRHGIMYGVSYVNRLHGWMMSDSSLSLTTTDGGMTWSQLPWMGTWFVAFAERFVNDTLGYVIGDTVTSWGILHGTVFHRSTNGGITWMRRSMTGVDQWLWGLDVLGLRWAWAVGSYDTLVLTSNSGATWQSRYYPGQRKRFRGCAFGDSSIGIAVTDYPSPSVILRTSDGGITWSQSPNPTALSLYGVEMVDPPNAWVCGDSGVILASSDGGMNWTAQVSGTRARLRKIWFVDDRQGWAVGDSGVILHTEDGGWSGVCSEPSRLTLFTSRLKVTPNPFTSFATLPGHEAERFSLYDISGRRVGVYRGDRIGEGLAPGVYFMKPEGQGTKPLRVVKVR